MSNDYNKDAFFGVKPELSDDELLDMVFDCSKSPFHDLTKPVSGQIARRISSGKNFRRMVARQERAIKLLLNYKTDCDHEENRRLIALARILNWPYPSVLPEPERTKVREILEEYSSYYCAVALSHHGSKRTKGTVERKRERTP